jgi:hypothetical protein
MKHRSWFLRFVFAAALALAAAHIANADPTTIAMRKCSFYACDNAMSLKNEARMAGASLPLGSIVFVSSQQYPLSAFVRICSGPRGGKDGCLITAGDLGAIELDNEIYARAAAIAPIDIPAHIAGSASGGIWELVQGHVLATLTITGRNGINPWHNLLNPLTWPWMEIVDERTDAVHRVYSKDRITLRFADGSTAQIEMLDVAAPSGHYFRFLPETIRLPNGELAQRRAFGRAHAAAAGNAYGARHRPHAAVAQCNLRQPATVRLLRVAAVSLRVRRGRKSARLLLPAAESPVRRLSAVTQRIQRGR